MSKQPRVQRRGSLGIGFETLWRSLRHGYDNFPALALMGVIWWVGALLIVPIGPLTAGLHRVTQRMSEERVLPWRAMLERFRADLGWSSRLAASLAGGLILLLVNVNFYSRSTSVYLRYLSITFLLFTILWLGVAVMAFAVALRQKDLRVTRTLRNTLLIVFANAPGVAISLVLLFATTLVFFVLPPLVVLAPGWIALWGEEQTRLLLVRSGFLEPDEVADRVRGGG